MNEWEKNRRMAEQYRQSYPPGTRVLLLDMDDPYAPVPSGTRGTVAFVDDQSQIHMQWDNGRGLALIPGILSLKTGIIPAKDLMADNMYFHASRRK